mmetsp:Transcript_73955/g.213944  ORF Transcript_73955/g.213944 Transcript_73955/m.213944 type:complete len:272 (-) Transcript_73955:1237-2052(-)
MFLCVGRVCAGRCWDRGRPVRCGGCGRLVDHLSELGLLIPGWARELRGRVCAPLRRRRRRYGLRRQCRRSRAAAEGRGRRHPPMGHNAGLFGLERRRQKGGLCCPVLRRAEQSHHVRHGDVGGGPMVDFLRRVPRHRHSDRRRHRGPRPHRLLRKGRWQESPRQHRASCARFCQGQHRARELRRRRHRPREDLAHDGQQTIGPHSELQAVEFQSKFDGHAILHQFGALPLGARRGQAAPRRGELVRDRRDECPHHLGGSRVAFLGYRSCCP